MHLIFYLTIIAVLKLLSSESFMYNSESDLSQDDNNALQSILQANCDEVHSFND